MKTSKRIPSISDSTTIGELFAAGFRPAIHPMGATHAQDGAAIPLQENGAAWPAEWNLRLCRDGENLIAEVATEDGVVLLSKSFALTDLPAAKDDEPSRDDNDDPKQPVRVAADLFRPSVTNPARSVHDLFPSHIRYGGR